MSARHDSQLLPAVSSFLSSPKQLLIDGEWVDAKDGTDLRHRQPGDRGGPRPGRPGVRRRRRPRRRRGPQRLRGRLAVVADDAARPLAPAVAHRRPDRRAGRGVRPARVARQRQEPRVGRAATSASPPSCSATSPGWATKMEGTTIPMSVPGREFHAYTRREADRRRRRHRAVELPADHGRLQDRPGDHRGQHGHPQAGRADPADRAAPRRAAARGRRPRRRRQRRCPASATRAPRSSTTPTSTRSPSPAAPRSARRSPPAPRGNLKKVSLELGGKAPNIIFADADLDAAIAGAALAGYFNEGQCCVNGSRLYVQRDVFDQVIEGVAAAARAITVGDALRPRHHDGPAGLAGAAREGHGLRPRRGRRRRHARRRQRRPGRATTATSSRRR